MPSEPTPAPIEIVPELKAQCGACQSPLKILGYKDGLLIVEHCETCIEDALYADEIER
jgi:hypothetical protein